MPDEPLTAQCVAGRLGLDERTTQRLDAHVALVRKWQDRINLVGRRTLDDPWRRHVLDSAQLSRLIPAGTREIVDIGSGAGFPGIVLAIVTGCRVHAIESDQRKAVFLREAARITESSVEVHAERIEKISPIGADVVTARALAPLPLLLEYAVRHLAPDGIGLFLKGREGQRELTESSKDWMMTAEIIESLSDPSGTILKIEGIGRRHGR